MRSGIKNNYLPDREKMLYSAVSSVTLGQWAMMRAYPSLLGTTSVASARAAVCNWGNGDCRNFQTSSILGKSQSGRFTVSIKHNKPLTYEEAHQPCHIAGRKSWNSFNTSSLDFKTNCKKRLGADFGLRTSQTLTEDVFIRKFMTGTWHSLFLSEILIKRQSNMIRIAGIVLRSIPARKMYFLIGYTEELLSYWLQCPVKLELQTVEDRKDIVYKYV